MSDTRKILAGVGVGGVLVAVGLVGACGGPAAQQVQVAKGSASQPQSTPSGNEETPAREEVDKGGDAVPPPKPDLVPAGEWAAMDGQWKVKVVGVETTEALGDPQTLGEKCQGVCLLVDLRVKNVGDEPAGFNLLDPTAYDAEGRQYSSDPMGYLENTDEGRALFNEMNPGQTDHGVIAYDVPKGAELVKVELMEGIGETFTFALP